MGILPGARQTPDSKGAMAGLRLPPHRDISLRSNSLTVSLDAEDGLPFRYDFNGESIWGEDIGAPMTAILCRLEPRCYNTVSLKAASLTRTSHSVVFRFAVPWEHQHSVSFSLRYSMETSSIVVTMEDVVEHPGFELIEVALPNLATVREGDQAAWMAQGRDGGSFVRVAEAKPYRFPDDENFGRISTELPIGAVGVGSIGCLLEVTAFMDGTETFIAEVEGMRRARIGTIQVHRVHGGGCYEMNDGNDAVCGNARTPNLLVEQQSRCRLDFFKVQDPQAPWFTAAKLLQTRIPSRPTAYFDDKFLFMIAGKQKTEPEPRTTFAQSRKLIGDIALLTDYAPQVAFISGWVYDGQDTGYPSEDVVNTSLGTYDELMRLMEDSRALDANVSVNVNYDDAYMSSPLFDPAFIAREPNGALWKARAWDGEDSYIVGMAKYVLGGWARRRIDAMMARYRLRHAMLIDAMSWFTIRNDWDVKHPASGYKNLVDGKWNVIEEFRKRGVYVTSEKFRYPMIGKLALTVNGPEPSRCPFGGEQIPLTAIVYRKAAIFGGSGDGKLRPRESLFWNSRPGLWFENKTDRKEITDFYYLVVLPYNKVHLLNVESYYALGAMREIRLEGDSTIWMDDVSSSYGAKWRGATITANESTTCPVDAQRIAFYSKTDARLSYPFPPHWSASEVTARRLTVNGREPFALQIQDGQIVVDIPARVPVILYAGEGAIATSTASRSA
jgi:glycosyl hydrolase family 101 (putative endo-alpha-N-acetylgalactosaminidase)